MSRSDPNKGSNIGWFMLAGTMILAVAFAFAAGSLCGPPERWEQSSETKKNTPSSNTPSGE